MQRLHFDARLLADHKDRKIARCRFASARETGARLDAFEDRAPQVPIQAEPERVRLLCCVVFSSREPAPASPEHALRIRR
jgi:hypothetical protein